MHELKYKYNMTFNTEKSFISIVILINFCFSFPRYNLTGNSGIAICLKLFVRTKDCPQPANLGT